MYQNGSTPAFDPVDAPVLAAHLGPAYRRGYLSEATGDGSSGVAAHVCGSHEVERAVEGVTSCQLYCVRRRPHRLLSPLPLCDVLSDGNHSSSSGSQSKLRTHTCVAVMSEISWHDFEKNAAPNRVGSGYSPASIAMHSPFAIGLRMSAPRKNKGQYGVIGNPTRRILSVKVST